MTRLHAEEEANLRAWLAGSQPGQAVVLSRAVVEQVLAEVDAARAGRPVVVGGAPVSADTLAREAAQLAPDGEE